MYGKVRRIKIRSPDGRILLEEEITAQTVNPEELESFVDMMRLMSNESRFKVIRLLADKPPCTFTQLHRELGYSEKTIAQCLEDLVRTDAIDRGSDGYRLSPLGRILLSQMREMAYIAKRLREMENLQFELE